MDIQLKDLLLKWGENRVLYFITTKIYDSANNIRDMNISQEHVDRIENTAQFHRLANFSYNEMKDIETQLQVQFSKNTQTIANLFENQPHNYELPNSNFQEDKCFIMVDASLKVNGSDTFYGIAGCVRNTVGNIVLGFAKPVQAINKEPISTTILELMAIYEGTKLAKQYNLKEYTIISDCSGNVRNINELLNNFTPLSKDYQKNKNLYNNIINLLKESSSSIAYVPREYNYIADEYSKSYMKQLSKEFSYSENKIQEYSEEVLSGKSKNSTTNIYFYHKNIISYLHNNPYDLEKGHLKKLIYQNNQNSEYDIYVMPYYDYHSKKFYNYSLDLKNNTYQLLFEFTSNATGIDSEFNNLEAILHYCKDKKVALFANNGVVAQMNKIAPIANKVITYYQKIYKATDSVNGVAYFLKEEQLYKSIHKMHTNNIAAKNKISI